MLLPTDSLLLDRLLDMEPKEDVRIRDPNDESEEFKDEFRDWISSVADLGLSLGLNCSWLRVCFRGFEFIATTLSLFERFKTTDEIIFRSAVTQKSLCAKDDASKSSDRWVPERQIRRESFEGTTTSINVDTDISPFVIVNKSPVDCCLNERALCFFAELLTPQNIFSRSLENHIFRNLLAPNL